MHEMPQGGLPGDPDPKPPSYRVILTDGDGRVSSITPLPLHDDVSAKAAMRRMAGGLSAELWDGLRYIDRFDAGGRSS